MRPDRFPPWPRTLAGLLALLLAAWLALPSLAALSSVTDLFRQARYADARSALDSAGAGNRPGEEVLWRSRLAARPDEALALLQPALGDSRIDGPARIRIACEVAELQAGKGNHRAVVDALSPLLTEESGELPGAVHLRAGLSLRSLGLLQQAREMLASVRPGDPEFVLARYYLGDISLEQNEVALAQRYFEAADKAAGRSASSRVAAGLWRAKLASGHDREADEIRRRLTGQDPGSLAMLEIRRHEQLAADERLARTPRDDTEQVVTPPTTAAGRFTLQFGAFSDRGLALEFQKRYRRQVPELRIDRVRDNRGQFLYKVRTGEFVNPAQARSEAKQIGHRLGLEVIVSELTGAAIPVGE